MEWVNRLLKSDMFMTAGTSPYGESPNFSVEPKSIPRETAVIQELQLRLNKLSLEESVKETLLSLFYFLRF